jgi:hypothetical protein
MRKKTVVKKTATMTKMFPSLWSAFSRKWVSHLIWYVIQHQSKSMVTQERYAKKITAPSGS